MSLTLRIEDRLDGTMELVYQHSNSVRVPVGDIVVAQSLSSSQGGLVFRFERDTRLGREHSPVNRTRLQAAQYDALAWAEENIVALIDRAEGR